MLDVAVIIVSWNVRDFLAESIASVKRDFELSELSGQVWVVDNNSTDGTVDLVTDLFPDIRLIRNEYNPGFGAANNMGIEAVLDEYDRSSARYLFFLNPDTYVREGALRTMIDVMDADSRIAAVAPRLVYGNGALQHSAFKFPGIRQIALDLLSRPARLYDSGFNGRYRSASFSHGKPSFEVDHLLGAAMLVRSDVVEATGGFDEAYFMYCEEIDWCWRIRKAGWTIRAVPSAEVVHYAGASSKQAGAGAIRNLWISRATLYRSHRDLLRRKLARAIVKRVMSRKAAREQDSALKAAYLAIVDAWSTV